MNTNYVFSKQSGDVRLKCSSIKIRNRHYMYDEVVLRAVSSRTAVEVCSIILSVDVRSMFKE